MGNWVEIGLREFVRGIVSDLNRAIEALFELIFSYVLRTPHPKGGSGAVTYSKPAPHGMGWPRVYEVYWHEMVPLGLLILSSIFVLVLGSEAIGGITGFEKADIKRRTVISTIWIFGFWPLMVPTVWIAHGLTISIAPTTVDNLMSSLNFIGILSGGITAVVGLLILGFGWFLGLVVAGIFMLRWPLMASIIIAQPVLAALWVLNIGPLKKVASIAGGLAHLFPVLVLMNVPAALFFRVSALLVNIQSPISPSLGELVASLSTVLASVVILIGGIISPWLVWKTSGIGASVISGAKGSVGKPLNQKAGSISRDTLGKSSSGKQLREKLSTFSDGQSNPAETALRGKDVPDGDSDFRNPVGSMNTQMNTSKAGSTVADGYGATVVEYSEVDSIEDHTEEFATDLPAGDADDSLPESQQGIDSAHRDQSPDSFSRLDTSDSSVKSTIPNQPDQTTLSEFAHEPGTGEELGTDQRKANGKDENQTRNAPETESSSTVQPENVDYPESRFESMESQSEEPVPGPDGSTVFSKEDGSSYTSEPHSMESFINGRSLDSGSSDFVDSHIETHSGESWSELELSSRTTPVDIDGQIDQTTVESVTTGRNPRGDFDAFKDPER